MGPSIADYVKELARQQVTGDTDFYKSLPYAFKLVTKPFRGPTGQTGEALFPLPIPPQVFEYDLEFAAEVTGASDSGVIAEEGGIVIGQIHMSATTGFKLRKNRDTSLSAGAGQFTGMLPGENSYGQNLSGQMALWRLLGRCFDAYSELKKDPETAHLTYLELHCLKDRLHLETVPRRVKIIKNPTPYRVTYGYEIDISVIGAARHPLDSWDLSRLGDDKGIWDTITDTIAMARKAVSLMQGTLDDLNATLGDLQRHIGNITGIVGDMARVIESGNNFITGAKAFFDQPRASLLSMVSDLEEAAEEAWGSPLPAGATKTLSESVDHTEALMVACTGRFKDDWDHKAEKHLRRAQWASQLTDEERAEIAAASERAAAAPGDLTAASVFDAPYRPGDATRATVADQAPAMAPGTYTGFVEAKVRRGDSIESIAIKYTGDPDRWRAIARANGLRPPYISQGARIPDTKRVGDPIIIPIARPLRGAPVATTGGADVGASQVEALLGTDIKLVKLSNGHWGWAVDVAHGSTDFQTVVGTPCLVQGLGTRMRTERRTNPQFPGDGLPRLVGTKSEYQLWLEARFAIEQQMRADPRIDRIVAIKFSVNGDVLEMHIDAQPIGYDSNRVIPLQVT